MAKKLVNADELQEFMGLMSEEVKAECLEAGAYKMLAALKKKLGAEFNQEALHKLATEGPKAFRPKRKKHLGVRDRQLLEHVALKRLSDGTITLKPGVPLMDQVQEIATALAETIDENREAYKAELQGGN